MSDHKMDAHHARQAIINHGREATLKNLAGADPAEQHAYLVQLADRHATSGPLALYDCFVASLVQNPDQISLL